MDRNSVNGSLEHLVKHVTQLVISETTKPALVSRDGHLAHSRVRSMGGYSAFDPIICIIVSSSSSSPAFANTDLSPPYSNCTLHRSLAVGHVYHSHVTHGWFA